MFAPKHITHILNKYIHVIRKKIAFLLLSTASMHFKWVMDRVGGRETTMPCPVLAVKVFTELLVVLLELASPWFRGLSIFCALPILDYCWVL